MIDLKALAAEHNRPLSTLVVLDPKNDPFFTDRPHRRIAAEWFAALWRDLDIPLSHVRRIHYRLISLPVPPRWPNGAPHVNTDLCAVHLNEAARDAVLMGLIPGEAIIDNKNAAPIEYLVEPTAARLDVADDEFDSLMWLPAQLPALPRLALAPPSVAQRYHLELWCEKSTIADVLIPLGQRYGVNVVTGTGDLSATACRHLVNRAERSARPVRILYISDFDPGGNQMPVGVARKIEFELYKRGRQSDLDVQVRPVVLTHAQCVDMGLPRTPTKPDDGRAACFERRFGEGATELDALEAIYPGKLAEILAAEIERYHDSRLNYRVEGAALAIRAAKDRVNAWVAAAYQPEQDALAEEYASLQRLLADFADRAKDVRARARASLEASAPDLAGFTWPEPAPGDEDPDPLFDSRRTYVDQVDRYKAHQGKPTTRKERSRRSHLREHFL